MTQKLLWRRHYIDRLVKFFAFSNWNNIYFLFNSLLLQSGAGQHLLQTWTVANSSAWKFWVEIL